MRFSNQHGSFQNHPRRIRRKMRHQKRQKRIFNDDTLKRLPQQNTNDPFANQLFNGLSSFF
ncbi:hypothetical protein RhiirC2_731095 [Rhizophagus irregularis]|uniref:Uncharacterized protein n=1 Tax=Rhizophagus irregularis TaxID=588596 RepID=A0A2N1NVE1_9GLOM|nr:hypothetical protein RhiirC2_731095 [Rhizophagus irregularis]